jgi:hypothetical protein
LKERATLEHRHSLPLVQDEGSIGRAEIQAFIIANLRVFAVVPTRKCWGWNPIYGVVDTLVLSWHHVFHSEVEGG